MSKAIHHEDRKSQSQLGFHFVSSCLDGDSLALDGSRFRNE